MVMKYEMDVVAWAKEQAQLIRDGKFALLDLEHIAEEIEDVGKSEQRELANRMALLLTHLLKWQFQPERQGNGWARTIKERRNGVLNRLEEMPSLKAKLADLKWRNGVWSDAVAQASDETGLACFPESCPWKMADVLTHEWLPGKSLEKKTPG